MSSGQPQLLVVGLGNPGPDYESTPHNLGFMVLDRLAEKAGVAFRSEYCQSLVAPATLEGTRVLLAKPLTFMNLSGTAVKGLLAKHGLGPAQWLVGVDELDLPWGSIRIRASGSAGSHNGVRHIVRALGNDGFARVRLGINPGHEVRDLASYVLAPIRGERAKQLEQWLDVAAEAVCSIITEGVEKAMTRHNRRAQG